MKASNSGLIYAFPLDHGLGYGFAELYDFTDESVFDGRFVFVYNLISEAKPSAFDIDLLRKSGVALGPIVLFSFPGTRGKGAWRLLGKIEGDFFLNQWPVAKDLRGVDNKYPNWNKYDRWHLRGPGQDPLTYFPYDEIRRYETMMLNSTTSVVQKFSMKQVIDSGKNVADFYDLSDWAVLNAYKQLLNTYYPEKVVERLTSELPPGHGA